jgi:zinc-ribbon domain
MAKSRGILGASGGGFGAGLLLLVGGLTVQHSQASMVAACSSGLGQFGQALNANAARQCVSAQDLSGMATGAMWVGAILLVVAVGTLIFFLASSRKPKVVVPVAGTARPAGPGRGSPPPPRAGEGAVLRPVVPSVARQPAAMGQPAGLPAYRPGPGCGHEVDDGARFCTVCGHPAAGERDGFAVEQPVLASGSEITTVLPVFAPPEPVGVPAAALAAGRAAERSLAGVASGSQLSWADRPPAPGGVGSSPLRGWADPPPAPGGRVGSGPSWEQASPSPAASVVGSGPSWEQASPPAASVVGSGPPWEQASSSPAASLVGSGPPWEQASSSPAASVVRSGPPWDRAEPSPAPGGTGPGSEVIIPRQSGRHRSRRP